MKGKKLITLLLTVFLAIGMLLSGCSSSSKTASKSKTSSNSSKKETKTFTLFFNTSTASPIDFTKTPVWKKLEELTGVHLKVSFLVGSDEQTKATLMINSRDLPDLIATSNTTFELFRNANLLVPLDDYIEKYGTNIKRWYSQQDLNKMRAKDGHIYYLTPARKTTYLYPYSGFYLPLEVLREEGWPKKLTLDQYFNIIEDYLKKHPTYNGQPVIGFTALTDNWRIFTLTGPPSYLAGNANTGDVWVDDNNKAHPFAISQWAHDYYKKLNEEWNKGIVDRQMFTRNYDSYKALIASGRVLGFYDQRWQIQDAINSLEQQKLYDRVPFALPVTFPGVKKETYNSMNMTGNSAGISITKSCKDPVAAFKFLDAMASDEALKLANWGIEGKDYTLKDGKMYMTQDQLAQFKDTSYTQKEGIGLYWYFPHPNAGSKFADGNFVFPQDTPEYIASSYKPYEKEVLNAYHLTNLSEMMSPPIETPYGFVYDISIPDSEQQIKIANQKASDLTRKYLAKMIPAKPDQFENIWKEYVSEMKKAKYDLEVSYIQKQIDWRIQHWGTK
ncbi:ABC transporter substrate-binding protein [Caldanaerobius polysaccharolyticus]|uniref:ABC transporter substrate-binding protein n=1 Tax=Caldanaerobius polysaccharolyticus TaxID=44256 RepID=UPI00047D92DC|nr:ABC transporter substrate-binding protein [Caldanaerobius polysaccharolyticus]